MGPFLYVTDLHGNRRKYERTLALAVETGARLVVNGGDMYPHGRTHGDQERFLREFLDPHFAKYQEAGIRHFGFPANDDLRTHDPQFDAICSRYPLVENLAGRKIPAGPYEFLGFNLVSDFPFRLKDRARMDDCEFAFPVQFGGGILSRHGGWEEIPDWEAYARTLPTIEEELAALPAPDDPGRAVYVIHGPPAGLGLDVVRGGGSGRSPPPPGSSRKRNLASRSTATSTNPRKKAASGWLAPGKPCASSRASRPPASPSSWGIWRRCILKGASSRSTKTGDHLPGRCRTGSPLEASPASRRKPCTLPGAASPCGDGKPGPVRRPSRSSLPPPSR